MRCSTFFLKEEIVLGLLEWTGKQTVLYICHKMMNFNMVEFELYQKNSIDRNMERNT